MRPVSLWHDRHIRNTIQLLELLKPLERLELLKPLHVINVAHFAHTAVGPESYGRGGIANIYDEKSHNSLMKMLRHSIGSPWHWSSICSFWKIGWLRSQ